MVLACLEPAAWWHVWRRIRQPEQNRNEQQHKGLLLVGVAACRCLWRCLLTDSDPPVTPVIVPVPVVSVTPVISSPVVAPPIVPAPVVVSVPAAPVAAATCTTAQRSAPQQGTSTQAGLTADMQHKNKPALGAAHTPARLRRHCQPCLALTSPEIIWALAALHCVVGTDLQHTTADTDTKACTGV